MPRPIMQPPNAGVLARATASPSTATWSAPATGAPAHDRGGTDVEPAHDGQVSHRALLAWIGLGAIGWTVVGGVVAVLVSIDLL